MNVELFVPPEGYCSKCDFVKKWLDRHHVPYDVLEATDEVRYEYSARGFLEFPIVVYNGKAHCGVRTGELESIAAQVHYFRGGNWGEVDD